MIEVIDTETTGFEPKDGGIVEIAMVSIGGEGGADGQWFQSLVNPGFPIGCEAMGTHHITEEMVADARSLDVIIAEHGLDLGDVYAAHNADFDRAFLPDVIRNKRWICSWRCAMHLWPDAPSHKNQALRYWLKLDVSDMPEEAGRDAHRALYDAWVTAKLVRKLMDEVQQRAEFEGGPDGIIPRVMRVVDELVRLSSAPLVLKKFRFGKHKDEPVDSIPKDYLRWILKQDFDKDVIHTAKHHLGILL